MNPGVEQEQEVSLPESTSGQTLENKGKKMAR